VSFGVNYMLPLLPEFLGRYPRIRADWQFDNRQVDLIAEGFDAGIWLRFSPNLRGGIHFCTSVPPTAIALSILWAKDPTQRCACAS
jgi:DNA-binding transcriptional LysR family regulator